MTVENGYITTSENNDITWTFQFSIIDLAVLARKMSEVQSVLDGHLSSNTSDVTLEPRTLFADLRSCVLIPTNGPASGELSKICASACLIVSENSAKIASDPRVICAKCHNRLFRGMLEDREPMTPPLWRTNDPCLEFGARWEPLPTLPLLYCKRGELVGFKDTTPILVKKQ